MLSTAQLAALRTVEFEGRNRVGLAKRLAGVTQVELAAATGFTQSYISKVENGQYTSELPGETMRAFATFFGCSIEDLFPPPNQQAVA